MVKISNNLMKRFRNRTFVMALAAKIILLIQLILAITGHGHILTDATSHELLVIVDVFLGILSSLGFFVDSGSGQDFFTKEGIDKIKKE